MVSVMLQLPQFKWTPTIAAGRRHTVAIKADGTAVATGDNRVGQCDISQFHHVRLPNCL